MGGVVARSSAVELAAQGKAEAEIIRFILPIYHTKEGLTGPEREAAVKCWTMISCNRCKVFFKLKKENPDLEWRSAAEWFPIVFYNRLFDVHPVCKPSFLRPITKQGGYLVQSVSLFLSLLDNPEKLTSSLIYLTQVHNKIGIKAYEYSIVGEVLLWALEKTLGPEDFVDAARSGWVKIYSVMLDIMLPVVVRFETQNRSTADDIMGKRPVARATAT